MVPRRMINDINLVYPAFRAWYDMLCMTYGRLVAILFTLGALSLVAYLLFSIKETPAPPPQDELSLPNLPRDNVATPIELNNQSSDPAVLAKHFYEWYLEGLATDQSFTDAPEFRNTLANWLTDDFVARWDVLIENTGHDPILWAQDYQNEWLETIVATTDSQTATSSIVTISLGITPQEHRLKVSLSKISDTWRVQDVSDK